MKPAFGLRLRSLQARDFVPWLCGAGMGLLLAALLERLLFAGQAQSFDAALYARSLWGIAHGDFHNPIAGQPSLEIHAQLVLFMLAPFARIWRAAHVLIAAQAVAFGATLALWLRALLRVPPTAAERGRAIALCGWGCVLFSFGSPLISNPFLFDARPEMLGVWLLSAGLLRWVERKRIDTAALACMLAACLCREEFALVTACALLFAPAEALQTGVTRRVRLSVAAACFAYFIGDRWLSAPVRESAEHAHLAGQASLALGTLQYKAALTLAALTSVGGLSLIGWRWLGSAVPGALGLLASSWLAQQQLSFHYSMFLAPGLLAASAAGYQRVLQRGPISRPAWLGHVVITLATGAVASAWPPGALFARAHFDVNGPIASLASWRTHTPWLLETHRVLARIPAEHALMVPYQFAAPLADRAAIITFDNVPTAKIPARVRQGIDSVVLSRELWFRVGRSLRQDLGMALWELSGTNYAVLSRKPRVQPLQNVLPRTRCEDVALVNPRAGIGVCALWRAADGHVHVTVRRNQLSAVQPILRVRMGPDGASQVEVLHILDGLVSLAELPPLIAAPGRTEHGIVTDAVRLELVDERGDLLPWLAGERSLPSVPVHLTTDLAAAH